MTTADLSAAVEQGFRSLIINRPDNEDPDQPTTFETTAAAEALGLQVRFIPVVSGQLTDQNITDMKVALAELPTPVLAHCRSGMRSAMLWALSQRGEMSGDDILKAAAEAGYDLSGIRSSL